MGISENPQIKEMPGLLPNLSSLFEPQRLSLKTSKLQAIVAALRMALLLVRRSHLSKWLEQVYGGKAQDPS